MAPLRDLLNVDDDGFTILVGWLLSCFLPNDGNLPVLVLTGTQDAAKTTATRVLRALTDPSSAPIQGPPREARDLMVTSRSSRVIAIDNLSHMPQWLSDALCCLATGGGMRIRANYSDDDEIVFSAKRPVILNGIGDVATASDLLSRSFLLRLQSISDNQRIDESVFWQRFAEAHPIILGALFDRCAAGLRAMPQVHLARSPRMGDAAKWAHACEIGMGETPRFLQVLEANLSATAEVPLAESPLTDPLLTLTSDCPEGWIGTATQLLKELEKRLPADTKIKPKGWPKAANSLTNKLRRLLPNLRKVYQLEIDLDGKENGRRFVSIAPGPDIPRKTSSESIKSSETQESKALLLDDQHSYRIVNTVNTSSDSSAISSSGRSQNNPGRSHNDQGKCGESSKTKQKDDQNSQDDLSRDISDTRHKKRQYRNRPNRGTSLDPEDRG